MKYTILIIPIVLLFFGCTPKQEIVEMKKYQFGKNEKVIKNKQNTSNTFLKENKSFEVGEIDNEKDKNIPKEVFKVAVIYPSKVVGKYANNIMNTVTGYLLYKNKRFQVETFDSLDENITSLKKIYGKIKAKGYNKILALLTINGYKIMSTFSYDNNMKIYFPLINSQKLLITKSNFIYGGISYEKQIKLLQRLSNNKNLMYYQDNYIGEQLKGIYENSVKKIEFIKKIKKRDNNYRALINDIRLNNSTIMLNTTIIKTSILLSQIRVFEKSPNIILSTQINYNPLLISLTQPKDRANFIISNSIDTIDNKLEDILGFLGSDVVYDWVNYSSLIGINILFDENKAGLIKTKVVSNNVIYDPVLYKNTENGFKKLSNF